MNTVSSHYYVTPAYAPAQQGLIGNVRQYISYHPQSALLASVATAATGIGATLAKSSNYLTQAVTALGVTTLLGTAYQWKHLPANMIGVPLLSLFGVQWRHGMEERLFEERKCFNEDEKLIGQVFYEKQKDGHTLPVLDLYSEDHYEQGFAQGYLLGKEIDDLFHRVLKPMIMLAQVATGDFSGSFYQRQVKKITIPESYAKEIQGLVEGVKTYAKERGLQTDLTEEMILNAHKVTDIYKSILCQKILGFSFFNSLGCSTAVVKKGNQIGVCRTLDWPSFGMMGMFTILRRHKVGETKIELQTFPGIIGALTAHNNHGLVAIINECGTISKEGIPYTLLTRQVVEQSKNVREAKSLIDHPRFQPASSHHLTLTDRREAINFQMLAVPGKKYLARSLQFEHENEYLVVTNHAVDENNQVMEHTLADSSSKKRFKAMQDCFATELKKEQPLTTVMQKGLLVVNTVDTVAAAIFTIQEDAKVIPEQYVHDNNFAALHLIK